MIPEKGQLVELRFNSGVHFDAIVEEWTDQKSILKLPKTQEIVIIQKTLQDVLLVKILHNPSQTSHSPVIVEELPPVENAFEEFERLKSEPISNKSVVRMSELKDEMNRLEREEFNRKLTSFEPTGTREIEYGLPRNLYVPVSAQHSEQEAEPPSDEFVTGLQKLFG